MVANLLSRTQNDYILDMRSKIKYGRNTLILVARRLTQRSRVAKQLCLQISAEAAQAAAEARTPGGQRRPPPRQANRGSLPKHLPREEIVIEPEAKACPCCS